MQHILPLSYFFCTFAPFLTYPVFFIIRHTPYVRLTALGESVMRCWLDILGIDWHAMTGENKDGYHGAWTDWQHKASLRGPSLFAPGYNDTTPITAEEVATKIAYIRSNPEHRLIAGCEDDWWKK